MTFYVFFTNSTLNLFALMQAFFVKVAIFYFLQSKCKKRPIGFSLRRGKFYDFMQQRIEVHIFLHNVGTYIKFCSKLELVWANFSEVAFSIRILTSNMSLIQLWCAQSKLNMDEICSLNIHFWYVDIPQKVLLKSLHAH